ncbi:MarR family winged helix-turn-helix transcriptional regulator [Kaistia terrae]|uniref:MarR family winged helix-turn-helix transcriptional regulator n=1 Tax=Kaistia terrae TaxID=537017 RepID=A0ABW0Q2E3_9HYPH|nr:MarR family transcriptional regulator [Kaistia terrae]MCX5578946.1 MarR family transcriptional regulator [Kaistia terrae]
MWAALVRNERRYLDDDLVAAVSDGCFVDAGRFEEYQAMMNGGSRRLAIVSRYLAKALSEIGATNLLAGQRQGLEDAEFQCLSFLVQSDGPIGQQDIAALFGSKSKATKLIDRLEAKGYVTRSRYPGDGPAYCDDCALQGWGLMTAVRAMQIDRDVSLLSMTVRDLVAVTMYLDRIAELARKARSTIDVTDRPPPEVSSRRRGGSVVLGGSSTGDRGVESICPV